MAWRVSQFGRAFGARIGIAIGRRHIRAVRLSGALSPAIEAMAVAWDGERAEEAAALVRARLERSAPVAVAVELDALFVKRVSLPAVAARERRRMLMLEPDRFFPVRARDLVATVRADDLVFAADLDRLETWLSALAVIGPIETVEPAPEALARALAHQDATTGAVLVTLDDHVAGCLQLRDGRLADVRKVRGGWADAAASLADRGGVPHHVWLLPWSEGAAASVSQWLPGASPAPAPSPAGLAPEFAAAYGAALALSDGPDDGETPGGLTPPALADRVRRRRERRFGVAVLATLAALVFALSSLGRYRVRVMERLDREIGTLEPTAQGVLEAQRRLADLNRRLATLEDVRAARVDPLAVLLALTRALPQDAYLRALHGSGEHWEVDGYASDAARILPALEASPVLADVRFRGPTSRVQNGPRSYEDFALAFRFLPAP